MPARIIRETRFISYTNAAVTSQRGSWEKELQAANVKAIRDSVAAQKEAAFIQQEINALKTQEAALNQRITATSAQITAAESRRAALTRAAAAVPITMANNLNALTGVTNTATAATARMTLATRLSAISTGVMATATTTASSAMKALTASMMTNPLMWIAGAVAGLVALSYWLGSGQVNAAKLNDEMSKQRETGDQTRATDERKMKRLQQLAAQQKLSNGEMKEAETLSKQLEGRYGDFGATIDDVTGSLTLAGNAMERFMDAMNAKALQELESELQEAQKNLDEVNREGKEIAQQKQGTLQYLGRAAVSTTGLMKSNDMLVAEAEEEWFEKKKRPALQKEYEIRKKIAAIKNGEKATDVAKDPNVFLDEQIGEGEAKLTERNRELKNH